MEQPSLSADGGFGARLRCPWAVAGPGCSGGAWPGFEPTRRATHQRPGAAGVEGAGGSGGLGRTGGGSGARLRCPWAAVGPGCGARGRWGQAVVPVGGGGARPRCRWVAAGPGRASRSTTPSRRLACDDLAGGPPPTGTQSDQTELGRSCAVDGGRAERSSRRGR